MKTTIREATPTDIEDIIEFQQGLANETEDVELSRQTLLVGIEAMFDDPTKGYYLIAEVDGKTAGGLMITTEWSEWRNAYFWWIQSVYVRGQFRKAGVYTALHRRVEEMARSAGNVCGIRLYVDHENDRAKATYERLGMTPARYAFYETIFEGFEL